VTIGLGILVAKVSIPHTLSNFQTAAHPETLSHPNDNEIVPHPAGRVNDQESQPQMRSQPQLQHI